MGAVYIHGIGVFHVVLTIRQTVNELVAVGTQMLMSLLISAIFLITHSLREEPVRIPNYMRMP